MYFLNKDFSIGAMVTAVLLSVGGGATWYHRLRVEQQALRPNPGWGFHKPSTLLALPLVAAHFRLN
jgi:hypothetical protein